MWELVWIHTRCPIEQKALHWLVSKYDTEYDDIALVLLLKSTPFTVVVPEWVMKEFLIWRVPEPILNRVPVLLKNTHWSITQAAPSQINTIPTWGETLWTTLQYLICRFAPPWKFIIWLFIAILFDTVQNWDWWDWLNKDWNDATQ